MGKERGEHLHEAGGHRFVAVRVVIPGRNLVRAGRVDRSRGYDSQVELPSVDGIPEGVPAVVEVPSVSVDPVGWHVQRGVDGTGREVAEERPVGAVSFYPLDPFDGPVGDVLGEVVVVPADIRIYRGGLIVKVWFELGRLGSREPVEAVEPEAGGPPVERAGRSQLPDRGEVPLAEHRGGVPVLTEDLSHRGRLLGDDRVVGGKTVGRLGDPTHVDGVVVPTRE